MGGTTSKYTTARGIGAQRSRVMSMALDRVRDEGVSMSDALKSSWEFVANEAYGVSMPTGRVEPDDFNETLTFRRAMGTNANAIAHMTSEEYDAAIRRGDAAIDAITAQYTFDELKRVIRLRGLDNRRRFSGLKESEKNRERLRTEIKNAARRHATHGDVFRRYEGEGKAYDPSKLTGDAWEGRFD